MAGKFGTEVHAPEWHGSTVLKRRFHESVSFDQQLVDISIFLMPSNRDDVPKRPVYEHYRIAWEVDQVSVAIYTVE